MSDRSVPPDTSLEALRTAIGAEAVRELSDAATMIDHCLQQLDVEQIWWRPDPTMNSIGNLVLHICGNVGQWIVAGLGGEPDRRQRQAEFDHRQPLTREPLRRHLDATIEATRQALANVTPEGLLAEIVIQGFAVTGLGAVIHSVSHFRGHTQEIVHLTRLQLGTGYKFHFVPTAVHQGGGAE